ADPNVWHDWSDEFHVETQRLAADARRMADDVRGSSRAWHAPGQAESSPPPPPSSADPTKPSESAPVEDAWWRSEHYVEPRRPHHHHPKSTGIVLVALGVLLLAANAGWFNWINWH